VAPRADSSKIGDLPEGRVLQEVPSSRTFPGWCPVAPRGFVATDNLAPAQRAPTPRSNTSRQSAAKPVSPRAPTGGPPAGGQGTTNKTAGTSGQLHEGREELAALQRARDALAADLERLQQEQAAEQDRLEKCRRQRDRMEEKLRRCTDVVSLTVQSMDRLQDLEEQEALGQPVEMEAAQAELVSAGAAVAQSLSSIAEEDDDDDGRRVQGAQVSTPDDKENAPPPGYAARAGKSAKTNKVMNSPAHDTVLGAPGTQAPEVRCAAQQERVPFQPLSPRTWLNAAN